MGIFRRPKIASAFLKGFFAPWTSIRYSDLCIDDDTSSRRASRYYPLASASANDDELKNRSSKKAEVAVSLDDITCWKNSSYLGVGSAWYVQRGMKEGWWVRCGVAWTEQGSRSDASACSTDPTMSEAFWREVGEQRVVGVQ